MLDKKDAGAPGTRDFGPGDREMPPRDRRGSRVLDASPWLWAAIAAALFIVWQVADALLLVFAGILLGVLLDALRRPVVRATGLGDKMALTLVCAGLLTTFAGTLAWAATV